jgi:hypothetical protein
VDQKGTGPVELIKGRHAADRARSLDVSGPGAQSTHTFLDVATPKSQQVSRRVTVRGMAPGTAGNKALQPFTATHASKDSNPRQPRLSWTQTSDRHKKA